MRISLTTAIAGVLAVALLGAASCGRSASPAMDADEVLRRMSQVLAGAPRMSFTARREADPDLPLSGNLPARTTISVRLVRPSRLAVRVEGEGVARAMYADGSSFTLQDQTKNLYSTIPLTATLDNLDVQLQQLYGFVPPMFEFITNKPYESIQARVTGSTYLGQAADPSGTLCHRLAIAGEVADAELWVSVAGNLPQQLTATFRAMPTHPQLRLSFSAWDLAPTWSDAELAFTPPAGAVNIPMRTVAEMQALIAAEKR